MSSTLLTRLYRPATKLQHLRPTLTLTPLPQVQVHIQSRTRIDLYPKATPSDNTPQGRWWHPEFAALKRQGLGKEEIEAISDEVKKDNEGIVRAAEERRMKREMEERAEEEASETEEKKE